MDDRAIIALFFERSEQAITELAKKYGSVCHRIALRIVGDRQDAEECVSDAYLAVWNTVPPREPEVLSSYLCRIVRNQAIKRYRANTAQKRDSRFEVALDEIEPFFPSASSVEEAVDAGELARALDRFLAGLDRESRVLFVRRYWFSDSIEDLAAFFHISKHNVSVRLSRIRKKLNAFLTKEGISV